MTLWIAFKNLIFDHWTQRYKGIQSREYRCELLSKILSLTIEHNHMSQVANSARVVNCFQKSYLWLLNTTMTQEQTRQPRLWIAFKNLIFDYWTQPGFLYSPLLLRCELLSKILSLTIEHNIFLKSNKSIIVVNCFQKSYLWLLNTTVSLWLNPQLWLWIAFKNLIFDYWTQRWSGLYILLQSCELLSKILSLTIEHNRLLGLGMNASVVNCFQKSYLWLLNTTSDTYQNLVDVLWIAFKNLIFDYWTQLPLHSSHHPWRCELLSKILSLTIEHNEFVVFVHSATVVNCFQKSYLWLLNTTRNRRCRTFGRLWIAFKNLIFDYWTQLATGRSYSTRRCELLSKILSLTIEHNKFKSLSQGG